MTGIPPQVQEIYPDIDPDVYDIYVKYYGEAQQADGRGYWIRDADMTFLQELSRLVSHYRKHVLGEHSPDQ